MDVAFFLAADHANQEASGKVNVLGIFNKIFAPSFPAKHRTLYLVIRIALVLGEYEIDHDMRILFVDQDGNELGSQDGKIRVSKPESGTQVETDFIIGIGDLLLPKPGRYEFRLVINRETKAIIPLDAVQTANNKNVS